MTTAIRNFAFAAVLTASTSGVWATEVHLSASVRADLEGATAAGQAAVPTAYMMATDSAEAAARIAATLRPYVTRLDHASGSNLTFSTAQIGEVVRAIPPGHGVATIDRIHDIDFGPDGRMTTMPFSLKAQLAHNVPQLRAAYDVSGTGVGVAVFDKGSVLASHVEFDNRVELRDPAAPIDDHATQVAGNVAASGDEAKGGEKEAQGIAPLSRIYSYHVAGDIEKLARIGASDPAIQITNHSYSGRRGWAWVRCECVFDAEWGWYGDPRVSEMEDYWFGKYQSRSHAIDRVVNDYPRLSIFVAAGNNRDPEAYPKRRDPNWTGRHVLPLVQPAAVAGPMRPPDHQHDGGYDTLDALAVAKNVITIGAMEDVPKHEELAPATVRVTAFSNWGPTDDGRIKPDLVANGSDLRVPIVEKIGNSYNSYAHGNKDGTSMAAPTAAGVGALLAELSMAKRGRPLRADEMKAALIATAISAEGGPTYRAGWGAIDAAAAGKLVAGDAGMLLTLAGQAEPIALKLARTSGPMTVTAAWVDVPASQNTGGLNDRTPALICDFDLELIRSDGKTTHWPWSLDPNRPSQGATREKRNRSDNVERIDVDDADSVAGTWTLRVITPDKCIGREIAVAIAGFALLK
jgi:hypothetical protein